MQAIKATLSYFCTLSLVRNDVIFFMEVEWSKTWCKYFPREHLPTQSMCSQRGKLLSNLQMARNTRFASAGWFMVPLKYSIQFYPVFLRRWAWYSLRYRKSLYMAIINDKVKRDFSLNHNFYSYEYVSVK